MSDRLVNTHTMRMQATKLFLPEEELDPLSASVSPESCGEVLAESVTVPSCDAYGATSAACARANDVVTANANE